jgi:phosphoglycolate phosphatase
MGGIELVVFDFDGTLAETRLAVSDTINAALLAHELPRVSPAFIHRLMGLPLEQLIDRMLPPPLRPYDAGPLVRWYRQHFEEIGAPTVRPMPGAERALDALAARGVAAAIATSRESSSLRGLLRAFGWEGRFVACITCDQVSHGKPHPETLRRALDAAGVHADRACMVGDTVWDMQMAVDGGVRAWGFSGGCHAADKLTGAGAERVLGELEELVTLFGADAPGLSDG